MTKTILVAMVFLTLGQITLSQTNFDKAKMDEYFRTLEENHKFMGSVAVAKNRRVIYSKAVGYADVENNTIATENSKYRVGSISKSFTAVLVLKAVEENRLRLDQRIDEYFPTIINAKKITIKHLLGHRSGIHNFTDDNDYLTWNTEPKTEKEMVEIISKGGSDFKPGRKGEYSNANFVLLTYILEKTFEKPFSDLLQEYIVQPIGLTNTYVFGEINPENDECKSYTFTGKWKPVTETHYTVPLGAGAIISTPTDLTKFADALFSGRLLTPESLETMKKVKNGYGHGLFKFPFYGRMAYGHTGGIDGFSAVYAHFTDDSISYALVSNGTNFNDNDISIAVLSAVYDKPYEIPVFTTYDLNPEDLDQYIGVYASKKLVLKITITKDESTLIAQGTGQPAFSLEATDKDQFKFDQAGAVFEFNPTDNTMILKQGGEQIEFIKQ